ncbi:MAG: flagellar hook assembly protein FlgD [Salinispira sp.]
MEGITSADTSFRTLNGIDRSSVQLGDSQNAQNFENLLSEAEQAGIADEVRSINREIQVDGREISQNLGKDDYLRLLITQLQNQDPTNPMEDREFIAQMAQFSSLEQMTNLSAGFQNLAAILSAGQATSMLGKEVEVIMNGNVITGRVQEITRGEYPQVLVNGSYFDLSDVSRIRESSQSQDVTENEEADV